MEVGTPASGICVAPSANALMPRHGHLQSRYLGPRSLPPPANVAYSIEAAGCSGRSGNGVFVPVA